tara:strand:+ start:1155 stop:1751 length:597 start_codon:yes stop_codon:yes gene_type:complete
MLNTQSGNDMKHLVLTALAVVLTPVVAQADVIDSARLGVMAHNIKVTDGKNANKEDGVNINGELRFHSPDFLKIIWSPHPYVMASVNSSGGTSYAGFGLEYDWEFADGWHFEIGEGYVIHDGDLDAEGDTASERAAYGNEHLLLGSRDLFRTNFALTRDFGDEWAGQLIFEHLSHGQILGNGRNQGLDEIGIRMIRKF